MGSPSIATAMIDIKLEVVGPLTGHPSDFDLRHHAFYPVRCAAPTIRQMNGVVITRSPWPA